MPENLLHFVILFEPVLMITLYLVELFSNFVYILKSIQITMMIPVTIYVILNKLIIVHHGVQRWAPGLDYRIGLPDCIG